MRNPSSHSPAPLPATVAGGIVWRGVLLVGLLWVLAIYQLGGQTVQLDSAERRGIAASIDTPLHANSEHSFSLKRHFSRAKNQPNSLESPEPLWLLLAGEFRAVPALYFSRQSLLSAAAPGVCWQQLQSLNVPRAPPLV